MNNLTIAIRTVGITFGLYVGMYVMVFGGLSQMYHCDGDISEWTLGLFNVLFSGICFAAITLICFALANRFMTKD